MIEISFKIASFFDMVFDEMLSGFHVVFLASWEKRMFKNCKKPCVFARFLKIGHFGFSITFSSNVNGNELK